MRNRVQGETGSVRDAKTATRLHFTCSWASGCVPVIDPRIMGIVKFDGGRPGL